MSYYVYMAECSDETLYTGSAADVDQRIHHHNSGKGAKYTRSRLPVRVVYREKCADKSAALSREAQLKRLSRAEKLLLCRKWSESHPPVVLMESHHPRCRENIPIVLTPGDRSFLLLEQQSLLPAGLIILANMEHCITVRYIQVLPQYRGNGLALGMLHQVLTTMELSGVQSLCITADDPGARYLATKLSMRSNPDHTGFYCSIRHAITALRPYCGVSMAPEKTGK